MRRALWVSVGLACVVALGVSGDAFAKTKKQSTDATTTTQNGRKPIEVERRSFLDPGPQVVRGTTNRYMTEQTFSNQDPIAANQRSWYMGETAPRRWDQPWSPGATVDWDDPLP